MTEDEAMNKICHRTLRPEPPSSTLTVGTFQHTIYNPSMSGLRCIGSQCMAWRSLHPRVAVNTSGGYAEMQEDKSRVIGGYCGLVNIPIGS